jgi:hypothetical protein
MTSFVFHYYRAWHAYCFVCDIESFPHPGIASPRRRGMKRVHKSAWMVALLMVLFSLVCLHPVLAAEKILVGQVNDNFQLVTSDQVYEIADTAEGNDLAENHVSAKVRVTATVEERDGMKIITVISYKVVSE